MILCCVSPIAFVSSLAAYFIVSCVVLVPQFWLALLLWPVSLFCVRLQQLDFCPVILCCAACFLVLLPVFGFHVLFQAKLVFCSITQKAMHGNICGLCRKILKVFFVFLFTDLSVVCLRSCVVFRGSITNTRTP